MMNTFCCDQCGDVDAVKLAYISGRLPSDDPTGQTPWLCTECQGRPWHHAFAKSPYRSGFDRGIVNREISRLAMV